METVKFNPPPCPSREGTLFYFPSWEDAIVFRSPLGRGAGVGSPVTEEIFHFIFLTC